MSEIIISAEGPANDPTYMVTLVAPLGLEGHGWGLYVHRLAQHWRVCQFSQGPALEGLERFESKGKALDAAEAHLRAGEAARRLGGLPSHGEGAADLPLLVGPK
jgi:hypothetical protein